MNNKNWSLVLKLILSRKDANALNKLLEILLSSAERNTITNRCLIFQELIKGKKTQREIVHDLKVSLAKVNRCSNAIKSQEDIKKLFSTLDL
jgi:TrpR family trp operon transcriptional repressor